MSIVCGETVQRVGEVTQDACMSSARKAAGLRRLRPALQGEPPTCTAARPLGNGVGQGAQQDCGWSAQQDHAVVALDAVGDAAGGGDEAEEKWRGYRLEETFAADGGYEGGQRFGFVLSELPGAAEVHSRTGNARP